MNLSVTYLTFSVDMLSYLISFFVMLMFVHVFFPLMHCLILYSYKTNLSFSPSRWKLGSNRQSSNFNSFKYNKICWVFKLLAKTCFNELLNNFKVFSSLIPKSRWAWSSFDLIFLKSTLFYISYIKVGERDPQLSFKFESVFFAH